MSQPPDERAEIDRLAHALPGWLAQKAVHGIGWVVILISYAALFGVWFGLLWAIGGWFGDSSLFDWFERQNQLIELVLALALVAGLLWGALFVAVIPATLISSLGAYFVDPEAKRSCGFLSREPSIGSTGDLDTHLRILSRAARLRLEAEASAKKEAWRAEYAGRHEAEGRGSQ
jgi:hypothetical protein